MLLAAGPLGTAIWGSKFRAGPREVLLARFFAQDNSWDDRFRAWVLVLQIPSKTILFAQLPSPLHDCRLIGCHVVTPLELLSVKHIYGVVS